MASSKGKPHEQKVACSICGKDLDPAKPLKRESTNLDLSRLGGFYCVDCWLRALRTRTAESLLAKALDRVLLR